MRADSLSHHTIHGNGAPAEIGALALGIALLVAGQRLFWLFVAAIGFITATHFASALVDPHSTALLLVIGLLVGVAGAVLAVMIQKFAVGIVGALAGGYYVMVFFDVAGLHELAWIGMLAGAIAGALLMLFLFRWTLIVLSSIAGAQLVIQALPLTSQLSGAAFLVLVAGGIVLQARRQQSR